MTYTTLGFTVGVRALIITHTTLGVRALIITHTTLGVPSYSDSRRKPPNPSLILQRPLP